MAEKKPAAAADTKNKSINKSTLLQVLSEGSGVGKKEIMAVFNELNKVVKKEVGKKGPGVFNLFGLVKIYRVSKPATKATTKANPFKPGEMMTVKAKPARSVVKVKALKDAKAAL